MRKRLAWTVVGGAMVGSLGAWTAAQIRPLPSDPGPIISGADIGFRPEGWKGAARTGTWMVRIHGRWVEAKESIGVLPAK